jgi:hypothetical protein
MNEQEQYPAVIIISRPPTKATPAPFVLIDDRILSNAAELAQRLQVYQMRAAAYTGPIYDYTVTPIGEAEAVAGQILAELTKENGAEAATPAPEPAPTQEDPTQGKDTTKAAGRQVELVVAYEVDAARDNPRLHNGGELVSLAVDGKPANPPTGDLNRLYKMLDDRGYKPAAFRWLGPAIGYRRQRLQVYTQAAS